MRSGQSRRFYGVSHSRYESLKPVAAAALLAVGLGAEQAASLGPIGSAIIAGGLASLVLAPAEATRIRMVSDVAYADFGLPAQQAQHGLTRSSSGDRPTAPEA